MNREKLTKVRIAAAAVGTAIVMQMADELSQMLQDGLLTDLIKAVAALLT